MNGSSSGSCPPRNTFETPPFTVEVTGTANLIDLNNRFLASDMVLGLLIAFGIVALIVGLLFRSLRMTLISLVPTCFRCCSSRGSWARWTST